MAGWRGSRCALAAVCSHHVFPLLAPPPPLSPHTSRPCALHTALHTPHAWPRREAAAAGCKVVTGDTMFVGQAADQFRLFTGKEAPVDLMTRVVLDSLAK